jgi:hypothetical protein
MVEEQMQWPVEPGAPPLPPPPARERRPRTTVDPLAGLAEELSRTPPASESGEIEPAQRPLPRREPRMSRPQPATPQPPVAAAPPADPPFNSAADQNLAEMAQRLEAALRRPGKDDNRPAPPPRAAGELEADDVEELAPPPPVAPPARAPVPSEAARPPRSEARPARPESKPVAQQKSLYDSLEQEMASLLGRPNGKT